MGDFGWDCPGLRGLPHGIMGHQGQCYRCEAYPFWPTFECQPEKPFRDRRWLFPFYCGRWPHSENVLRCGIETRPDVVAALRLAFSLGDVHCWEGQP